jgi:hypothetical protein
MVHKCGYKEVHVTIIEDALTETTLLDTEQLW